MPLLWYVLVVRWVHNEQSSHLLWLHRRWLHKREAVRCNMQFRVCLDISIYTQPRSCTGEAEVYQVLGFSLYPRLVKLLSRPSASDEQSDLGPGQMRRCFWVLIRRGVRDPQTNLKTTSGCGTSSEQSGPMPSASMLIFRGAGLFNTQRSGSRYQDILADLTADLETTSVQMMCDDMCINKSNKLINACHIVHGQILSPQISWN